MCRKGSQTKQYSWGLWIVWSWYLFGGLQQIVKIIRNFSNETKFQSFPIRLHSETLNTIRMYWNIEPWGQGTARPQDPNFEFETARAPVLVLDLRARGLDPTFCPDSRASALESKYLLRISSFEWCRSTYGHWSKTWIACSARIPSFTSLPTYGTQIWVSRLWSWLQNLSWTTIFIHFMVSKNKNKKSFP